MAGSCYKRHRNLRLSYNRFMTDFGHSQSRYVINSKCIRSEAAKEPLPFLSFMLQSVPRSPGHLPTQFPNIGQCSPIWCDRVVTAQLEGFSCVDRSRLPWFSALSASRMHTDPGLYPPPNLSISWRNAGSRGEVMNSNDLEKESGLALVQIS